MTNISPIFQATIMYSKTGYLQGSFVAFKKNK